MAKADGHVTRDEVEAFKGAFKVSPGEMKEAARAFNLAKRDATGYEFLASELVELFQNDRKLLEYVLEGLFHIAKADEEVHAKEEQFLGQVAKVFGFTDAEFSHIKARHVIAAKCNPYEVLGVEPSITDGEQESLRPPCGR
jgi:DnaJ like chaperone protein